MFLPKWLYSFPKKVPQKILCFEPVKNFWQTFHCSVLVHWKRGQLLGQCYFREPQNSLDWKNPPRSSSPSINPALSTLPWNHIFNATSTCFLNPPELWCNQLPQAARSNCGHAQAGGEGNDFIQWLGLKAEKVLRRWGRWGQPKMRGREPEGEGCSSKGCHECIQ